MKKFLIILTVLCLMMTMTGCIASIVEKLVDTAVSVISPKETEPARTQAPAPDAGMPTQSADSGTPSGKDDDSPVPAETQEGEGEMGDPAGIDRELFEETCQEAYAAYRQILCENWYRIQKYDWQKGHYGDDWEVDEIPTPVAILDIAGDEVPELIFIAGDAEYEYMTHLYIYTYRDGETLMVHDRIWDVLAGGGFYYTLFQVAGEKDLYAYWSSGDESWREVIIHLYLNSAGTYLKADDYLTRDSISEYDPAEDEYKLTHEYKINEAEVDEEEFEREFQKFLGTVDRVIMNTSYTDVLDNVPDAGVAQTLVEAVDWLSEQLPKKDSFDYEWNCGEDGDNVRAMLDLGAGILIIQGTGNMALAEEGAPWQQYATSIRRVVVCEGVTSIQNLASLQALREIYLPRSLKTFGRVSLGYCGVNYFGGKFSGFDYYDPTIYYAGSEDEYAQIQDEAERGKGYLFGTFPKYEMNTSFDWGQVNYKGIQP